MENNGEIHDFTDSKNKLYILYVYSILKGILFSIFSIYYYFFAVDDYFIDTWHFFKNILF